MMSASSLNGLTGMFQQAEGTGHRAVGKWGGREKGSAGQEEKEDMRSFLGKGAAAANCNRL